MTNFENFSSGILFVWSISTITFLTTFPENKTYKSLAYSPGMYKLSPFVKKYRFRLEYIFERAC